jgi:hypothetical protein
MEQQNQGKITIHEGQKTGEQLIWAEAVGEKEFKYFGEAKQAADMITWEEAEEISGQKLTASHALLIKSWSRKNTDWEFMEDRLLLLFVEEEEK